MYIVCVYIRISPTNLVSDLTENWVWEKVNVMKSVRRKALFVPLI